jgi:hypothetical protein
MHPTRRETIPIPNLALRPAHLLARCAASSHVTLRHCTGCPLHPPTPLLACRILSRRTSASDSRTKISSDTPVSAAPGRPEAAVTCASARDARATDHGASFKQARIRARPHHLHRASLRHGPPPAAARGRARAPAVSAAPGRPGKYLTRREIHLPPASNAKTAPAAVSSPADPARRRRRQRGGTPPPISGATSRHAETPRRAGPQRRLHRQQGEQPCPQWRPDARRRDWRAHPSVHTRACLWRAGCRARVTRGLIRYGCDAGRASRGASRSSRASSTLGAAYECAPTWPCPGYTRRQRTRRGAVLKPRQTRRSFHVAAPTSPTSSPTFPGFRHHATSTSAHRT